MLSVSKKIKKIHFQRLKTLERSPEVQRKISTSTPPSPKKELVKGEVH